MKSHSAFCASVSQATLRGLDLETHMTNAVQVRTSPSLQEVSSAGLLCPEGGGGAPLPPPLFIFPSQGSTPSSKTHNEALMGHPLALSPRSSPALLFPVGMVKAAKQSPAQEDRILMEICQRCSCLSVKAGGYVCKLLVHTGIHTQKHLRWPGAQ